MPSVTRLAIHEEGQQAVCFRATDTAATVLNRCNTSSLLEWFKTNSEDPAARAYTYMEFLRHYVYDKNKVFAALLKPGGRTAHSRFGIPIPIENNTHCK